MVDREDHRDRRIVQAFLSRRRVLSLRRNHSRDGKGGEAIRKHQVVGTTRQRIANTILSQAMWGMRRGRRVRNYRNT